LFRVELEVEVAQPSDVQDGRPDKERVLGLEPGQPEYRILIAEDEPENWMMLEQLLRGSGFQVRVADDGEQAVENFRQWQPNFIWMDLRMPLVDGLEATRRIRALPGGRAVKIVALTAGLPAEPPEILAAGVDDYIRKPYRPDEIFSCMERLLGVRYRRGVGKTAVSAAPATNLRPEDLAALPQELRGELRTAVISLDAQQISHAIEQVAQLNPALGSALNRYVGRYAYTPILAAIDGSMTASPGS
jgi:CheY-like chemotaxis protein